jgi:ubiquinone/menaquinone biosynthesis C-methylase UbiE
MGVSRRGLFTLGFLSRDREEVDYERASHRVVAGWDREGHEALLRALEPVALELVEAAGVGHGDAVLAAAAADGNVAAAALAAGAEVEACDLSRAMVARGRERVSRANWLYADVQDMPYPNGAFDHVLSAFGAVLAPRAKRTARELARVCAPGGTVALTAWTPDSLPGRVERLAPRPPGVRSPTEWGREHVARARFEPVLEDVTVQFRTILLDFPDEDALLRALLRPHDLDEAPELRGCGASVGAQYLLVRGRRRD